jgi:hypothetical protein
MRVFLILLAIVAVSFFVACGDDDDDDDGGATPVGIALQEWSVVSDVSVGPAGPFEFTIENVGPMDTHEFVIFKTDLAPGALPTLDDGTVDEEGEGVELIDEVEDIAVDATETLTVDLAAGDYVFICNILDEEEDPPEAHYQEGMRTGFSVR